MSQNYRPPDSDHRPDPDAYSSDRRHAAQDQHGYRPPQASLSPSFPPSSSSRGSAHWDGALSILSSCGLEPGDLSLLAELPEDVLTVESLPHVLNQLKGKRASVKPFPTNAPSSSSSRPPSSSSSSSRPPSSSSRDWDQRRSPPIRYPLAPPPSQKVQDHWGNPRSSSSLRAAPPSFSSSPSSCVVDLPPPRPGQTGRAAPPSFSSSPSSCVVDLPPPRPGQTGRASRDRPSVRSAAPNNWTCPSRVSESGSGYRSAPPPEAQGRRPPEGEGSSIVSLPTTTEALDFHGKLPAAFPYSCSLCDITVLSERVWTKHVHGSGHADGQLVLLQRCPRWDCRLETLSRADNQSEKSKDEDTPTRPPQSANESQKSQGNLQGTKKTSDKSKVVCVKFPAQSVDETYLRNLTQPFGEIVKILMFPSLAFVELGSVDQAKDLVKFHINCPPTVNGEQVELSISSTFSFQQSSRVVSFTPAPSGEEGRSDLISIVKRFGLPLYTLFLPSVAFVEMKNVPDAQKLVDYYSAKTLRINSDRVQVSLSGEYRSLMRVASATRYEEETPSTKRGRSQSRAQEEESGNQSKRPRSRERSRDESRDESRAKSSRSRDESNRGKKSRSRSRSRDKSTEKRSRSREKTSSRSSGQNESRKKTEEPEESEKLDSDSKPEPAEPRASEEEEEEEESSAEDSDIEGMQVIGEDVENEDVETAEEEEEEEEEEEDEHPAERTDSTQEEKENVVKEEEEEEVKVKEEEEEEVKVKEEEEEEVKVEEEEEEEVKVKEEDFTREREESADDEEGPDFPVDLENCITLDELEEEEESADSETAAEPKSSTTRVVFFTKLPPRFYSDAEFVQLVKGVGTPVRYFLIRRQQQGFIEMASSAEALNAARALNRQTFLGSELFVNISHKYTRLVNGYDVQSESDTEKIESRSSRRRDRLSKSRTSDREEACRRESGSRKTPEEESGPRKTPERESGSRKTPERESGSGRGSETESASKKTPEPESGPRKTPERESGSRKTPERESVSRRGSEAESTSKKTPEEESGPRKTPEAESGSRKTPEAESVSRRGSEAESTSKKTPEEESGPRKTPEAESGSRKTPEAESASRKTPEEESGPRKTPERESGSGRGSETESASRKTPEPESGPRKTPEAESASRKTQEEESGSRKTPEAESGFRKTPERESGSRRGSEAESASRKTPERELLPKGGQEEQKLKGNVSDNESLKSQNEREATEKDAPEKEPVMNPGSTPEPETSPDQPHTEQKPVDSDHAVNLEQTPEGGVAEPEKPTKPVGTEFVRPVVGYSCQLCQVIYADEDEAKLQHCSSLTHYRKYQETTGIDPWTS
ncbi:matrin 3-like 1.1 [Limanda limanda]|uniref:matrin 3-like 1.1 n=1 Tax=Limanda limanda TaxID=27771 RepID=UPI0029C8FEEF|nr:matrin 3-like 1.1 [Limanda limanda]